MMYPTVVTVVAIGITIFLLVKVVPTFADIFSSFGGKLPTPTQYLIKSATCCGIISFISFSGGGSHDRRLALLHQDACRARFWDDRRIKLPIFGHIAHKICLARFARTMASLVRSGVPILEVLPSCKTPWATSSWRPPSRRRRRISNAGEGISAALGKHPIFPTMIIRMMQAGEQTGKIDTMLERVADFLDEEIETTLSGLTSLIEPILIVFLGVVVGGIVICMFLPIFKLSELVSGKH
jgi:type IV pilus assembly protein PilC